MHPLLARVQDLSLYVLAQTEHTSRARKQFQFLLTHTSPLEGLQVGSWQGDTSDDTEHHLDLAAITADWDKTCDLPKLGWLDFIAVDLDPGSEWFIDDFDPVKLKDFYINGCVNIVPALTALAKVYFSNPGQLTELCII